MYASFVRSKKLQLAALSGAVALALVAGSTQAQISQSVERKNINRLGHTDLQGRSSYQPTPITYPDGRVILFAGLHSTIPVARPPCPAGTLPKAMPGHLAIGSSCDRLILRSALLAAHFCANVGRLLPIRQG